MPKVIIHHADLQNHIFTKYCIISIGNVQFSSKILMKFKDLNGR